MIELFSRRPGNLALSEDQLTRIPVDEDIVSLSAILLDEGYFEALQAAKRQIDGITIIDETLLIPFKARAFLDLIARLEAGGNVDRKDIKKHRNDVFRLAQLLPLDASVDLPESVRLDLRSSKARRSSCNLSRNGTIVTAYVTTYTEKISMRKGCEKNHHYSTQSALLSLRKRCASTAPTLHRVLASLSSSSMSNSNSSASSLVSSILAVNSSLYRSRFSRTRRSIQARPLSKLDCSAGTIRSQIGSPVSVMSRSV